MRSPATFISVMALSVSLFGNVVVWRVSENTGRRQAQVSRSARLELCREIEGLHAQFRRDALDDYADAKREADEDFSRLDRNLRLLKLERSPQVVEAAQDERDRRVSRAAAKRDRKLASNRPRPCPRPTSPNKEGAS